MVTSIVPFLLVTSDLEAKSCKLSELKAHASPFESEQAVNLREEHSSNPDPSNSFSIQEFVFIVCCSVARKFSTWMQNGDSSKGQQVTVDGS